MKSDSWFACYPADLTADTAHLSTHDFGAYFKLLCWYYRNGPLPNDEDALRNVTGVEKADWVRCKGRIMGFFSLNGDGRYHQKRADAEISQRNELNEKKRRQTDAARAARHALPVTDIVTTSVTENVTEPQTEVVTAVQPQPQPQPHLQPQQRITENKPTPAFPTLQEVKARGQMIGVPDSECERFWNHFEASGWIDKNGHPIVKWENKLATWAADARARPLEAAHKQGPGKPRTIYELRAIVDTKKALAAEIRTKYCSETGMSTHWSDDGKKAEYFKLMREAKQLMAQISNMQ